jgi:hypothetical protein
MIEIPLKTLRKFSKNHRKHFGLRQKEEHILEILIL